MKFWDEQNGLKSNRRRCRKGMVIELALLLMLVTFACGTLLISSAIIGRQNLNYDAYRMIEKSVADELAERVLADPTLDPEQLDDRFEGYTYRWEYDAIPLEQDMYQAVLLICDESEIVLRIRTCIALLERRENNEKSETYDELVIEFKILEWSYH